VSSVLITGMTASQTSEAANSRTLSFAGVISTALSVGRHTVTISAPEMWWTLGDMSRYDSIIVGVAPVTSVTASNAYGGLHVIDLLWNDPRLTLMVDAPRPLQIGASLRSVTGTPGNLIKPFYAKRRGYSAAAEPSQATRLLNTATRLLDDKCPATIYPSLPWQDASAVESQFTRGTTSLHGVNLDALLISDSQLPFAEKRVDRWVVDDPTSIWTQKISPTISRQIVSMKETPRQNDKEVGKRIAVSLGSLIAPHREGTWWTHRIPQSLSVGTPIATSWREASLIGSSWGVLPSTIESLSRNSANNLAQTQLEEYIRSIPSREEAVNKLEEIICNSTLKGKARQ
jgi:hypothetical protein